MAWIYHMLNSKAKKVHTIKQMGAEESRQCPRCKVWLTESNMAEHLKNCERFRVTGNRPDGATIIIEYTGPAGSGHNLAKMLTSGATNSLTYQK
ncbi:unnamed protein product [Didymodactylos carnosus]|uniref:Uncharacterized protein n=1 Tax=Didymodactylos carnosus TaxID=1234261 RepID=A0A815Y3U1_9BILA|nr:unnamed protein product [Didymodactylos carnosus]CAF4427786.1 unnamed protein product [Didymodactylos carnosus]